MRLSVPIGVVALGLTVGCRANAAQLAPAEGPVLITADQVDTDQSTGIVTATGHVEISQGERLLLADKVSYNQKTNVVSASGHVTVLEPSGEVLFADSAELSDDMKNGVIKDLRILMTDNSRFAAAGGKRVGGVETEMDKAVYSPCELCKEKPSRPPLWQLKANKVVHDQRTKDIEYYDAWMEAWGIPVAYTPYFSHPDPTVKRRSGLLAPTIGNKSDLGFVYGQPYFFDIAPNKDLTLEPIITSNQGPVLSTEYRQRFTNGLLNLSGSVTEADYTNAIGVVSQNQLRGHVRGLGRFDIDDTWRAGFDLARVSDDTYLRRYNFQHQDVLQSRVFAEGFRDRNYFAVNAYSFQGLRADDVNAQMPVIFPTIDYNFVSQPSRRGGFWTADTNLLSLMRDDGADSRRLSLLGGWHLPFKTDGGHAFEVSLTAQADAYYVNDVQNPANPSGPGLNGFTGRIFPQLQVDWSYPLVREHGLVRELIEPVAALIVGPNGGNPDKIPNEDSQSFEFDDTDLFTRNRFSGLDRVEGGQRVDYGIRAGAYGSGTASTTAFVGQSFRFRNDSTFPVGSGLEDRLSDIVGQLRMTPNTYYDVSYRFRLDKDTLSPRRNEIAIGAGVPVFHVGAEYIFIDERAGTGGFGDREELALNVQSKITKYWSLAARARQDLKGAGTLTSGLRAIYEDECFKITADFIRNRTRDREIQPTTTILFRLVFKNIGEVKG
ncbi:MAG: LPS-assembly protein LptD [Alphaproteobacteria bacterium]